MFLLIASFIALLLYLVATGMLAKRMRLASTGVATAKSASLWIGLGAGIAHAITIYLSIHSDTGINLGFFNALSLEGWLIALMVVLAAWRLPVENLGIALLPLAALTLILMLSFSSDDILPITPGSPLQIHILLSIGAYGVLTIAAVQAVALAIQDRSLHNRQPGGLIKAMPPLRVMESLLFQLISTGFVLLGLALLTGFLFLDDMFAQRLVHKTILSCLALSLFGILLWGRYRYGWRGRKAIRWTMSGFFLLLLAYFGSKFVVELLLV